MNSPIIDMPATAERDNGLYLDNLREIFRYMLTARELDKLEEHFTARGEAFFQVSGTGHEAVACLAPHLGPQDWLHCHYRDKALMLARGVTPEMFFLALFCKDASHSRGRQMSAHMSWRAGNVLSLCGPVGNNALQAAGIAAEVKNRPGSPVVLCALGDGTVQQGEVMEAIAEAAREALPVLFLIEDNRYAISSVTVGRTFYSLRDGFAPDFHGVPIQRLPGRDPGQCYLDFRSMVAQMRADRSPRIAVLEVERLCDHTNADDQRRYRGADDIEQARATADPIANLQAELIDSGVDVREIQAMRREAAQEVAGAARRARASAEPVPGTLGAPSAAISRWEYRGHDRERPLTMLAAIRETLRAHLAGDERVQLCGEDIEDPKGDVFGITSGLSTEFPGRVRNAPLSESTIVGTAIGRALAGARPVAFLQFADFLPLAFNQIAAELGSMHWRTDGTWRCPAIIMVPCGGYRPGLGPFHAQSLEALVAHMPGINVVMPSSAADAAGLLNTAFASDTPTIFFYPKACLNDRNQTTSTDIARHIVPLGVARVERTGRDLTMISYGNGMERCRRAAQDFAAVGCDVELIDLRSLVPWDINAVVTSVERTRRVLIVHEDNRTCGMGAEILATLTERLGNTFSARRVVREDTYVPCNFALQLETLPSYRRILEAAAALTDYEVQWRTPKSIATDEVAILALGSGPSDESVLVTELHVRDGDAVQEGQIVATVEATKACVDIESPCEGRIIHLSTEVGRQVAVGAPLMLLRPIADSTPSQAIVAEMDAIPLLRRRTEARTANARTENASRTGEVGLSMPVGVLGSMDLTNDAMTQVFTDRSVEEIEALTGIRARRRVSAGEDAVSLGTAAARQALTAQGLCARDIDLLICSTVTPTAASPSVACRILQGLEGTEAQAFDLSAACSGYLYALQVAHDYLQQRPQARVLVVTADVLSPLLDTADFTTCAVFADAATATVVQGAAHSSEFTLRLRRPYLSAAGDAGGVLRVPTTGSGGHIFMDGQKVFTEAVRRMSLALTQVCAEQDVTPQTLDWIVPHQANQRILNTLAKRLNIDSAKVLSNLAQIGNTSSSSIPLCLSQMQDRFTSGQVLGLVAFGAGFTYGAAILDVTPPKSP